MASARALARTYPVASLTHWLLCEAVHSASDLSHRYMGGPGLEREWKGMERCLERNGPLQHSPATTQHIFIKILAVWSEGSAASSS